MHPQLEILLQIQDLKAQRREIAEGEGAHVETREFRIDIAQAVRDLDQKIALMEDELLDHVRHRYDGIVRAKGRAVVPVVNGTCYGCFVAVPISRLAEISRADDLQTCPACGRFLYTTTR